METVLSICVGLGLAAACGFRVFVPLLVVSVASWTGHLTLHPTFAWMGTPAAMMAFGAATVFEICGYYIPWVDNLLDTVATPAAIVAGTVISASLFTNMSPFLQWSLAVVAGGGMAGLVQGGTVVTRAISTATTGGFGNPVLATAEGFFSILASTLSLIPILAAFVVASIIFFVTYRLWRRSNKAAAEAPPARCTV